MAAKCLPKYLLPALQPSTPTSRGLQPERRGLVDTCVEGCFSLIRLMQARNKGLSRGCRYFFLNCYKEIEKKRAKKVEKAYRNNNRAKYLHPLLSTRVFKLVSEDLKRPVIGFKRDGIQVRALYRSEATQGPNPGTMARRREVITLVRSGLEQALEGLVAGDVADLRTSGFTTREDTILCINEGDEAANVHKKRVSTTKGAR